MSNFKAALFDLDGVVFDTESQYTIFWGEECRRYHPEIPDLEHKIKGSTLVQIFDGWFDDVRDEHEAITQRLNEFELNMQFEYIEGFRQFLDDIKANGVRTAIVTSSNRAKMQSMYLQHPEFETLFDAVLTSEDFEYSKPHPDCYQKAAARLGCTADECVVFEDSFNGLKSGRAAEMTVVGLATTNPTEAIAEYADIVIPNFIETNYTTIKSLL